MIKCTCVKGRLMFRDSGGGAKIGDLSVETFRKAVRHTKELANLTQDQVTTSIWLNREWELTVSRYPSRWTKTKEGVVTLRENRLFPLTKTWPLHTLIGDFGEQ